MKQKLKKPTKITKHAERKGSRFETLVRKCISNKQAHQP